MQAFRLFSSINSFIIIVFSFLSLGDSLQAQEALHPSNAGVSVAYGLSSRDFRVNDTVSVNRSITNNGAFPLSNLYLTENLPSQFLLIGQTISINGANARNAFVGPVLNGEISGYNLFEWVIDYPGPGDSLDRSINPGERLDLVYDFVIQSPGNFTLPFHTLSFYSQGSGYFTVADSIIDGSVVINASAGLHGAISPSGVTEVVRGQNQTFAITPDPGYLITNVLVDGVSVGAVSSYTFNNVTSNHTITADFSGNSLTIIASAGPQGTISPSGNIPVNLGANIVFTITPNSGYRIESVLVDGASVGPVNSYTFNSVIVDHTISASFASGNTCIITSTAGGHGTISPLGNTILSVGSNITYTITPYLGYRIYVVLIDGISIGPASTYTFSNVTANHTISAGFAPSGYYGIAASAGLGGTTYPTGQIYVAQGGNRSYLITPNAGNHIADVLVDGISVGTANSYTFYNVTADHTISATFVGSSPAVTASAGPNGIINPAGQVLVSYGSSQTFAVTPDSGYCIAGVSVDGVSIGPVSSYTFDNVIINHTISASFVNDTLIIIASVGSNGVISPVGQVRVACGSSQTFAITPNSGYRINSVFVDGVSVGPLGAYIFNNVTANHTITASFVSSNLIITAWAGSNGTIDPAGQVSVAYGSSRQFTITPNPGYLIGTVLVDGVSVGPVGIYTFNNVIANHTVTAAFNSGSTFTIISTSGAHGAIAPLGSIIVNGGSNITFTITPLSGYRTYNVQVDGVSVGPVSTYTFNNVSANHTIAASFVGNTVVISASTGTNGTISPVGQVPVIYDSSRSFAITPNTGYRINSVLVDGVSIGPVSSYTFNNVIINRTISASFASGGTFTIASSAGAHGAIAPTGGIIINSGANITFTITPSPGYRINAVQVDGISIGPASTYTFSNVTANHTISADFVFNYHSITSSAGPGGRIYPSGLIYVSPGSNRSYLIGSFTGYHIANVLVDGVSVGPVATYTFLSINSNHTIAASFALNINTDGPTGGDPGSIITTGQIRGLQYVSGDANNDGIFNGLDVQYEVSYLKGIGPPPPVYCIGSVSETLHVAADVNGDCVFNAMDVIYGVMYLKGLGSEPQACPDCPPVAVINPPLPEVELIMRPALIAK